jgi:hypothetical protein
LDIALNTRGDIALNARGDTALNARADTAPSARGDIPPSALGDAVRGALARGSARTFAHPRRRRRVQAHAIPGGAHIHCAPPGSRGLRRDRATDRAGPGRRVSLARRARPKNWYNERRPGPPGRRASSATRT